MPISDATRLAAAVLHDPVPVDGKDDATTFFGTWLREPAYVRVYVGDPGRARIDLALRNRLTDLVPLPKVLAAEPRVVGWRPPYVVSAAVPGTRADRLLDRGLPPPVAAAVGRQSARLMSCLRSVRLPGHGPFVDADLRVGRWPTELTSLARWYRHHEPRLAVVGLGPRGAPDLSAVITSAASRLAGGGSGAPSLVHGGLTARHLVVDRHTGRLRAVLGWGQAFAGDWRCDVGSLLRDADLGQAGPGAASWAAFRGALVDALHSGIHEDGRPAAADAGRSDWLVRAQDLDLYALIRLAAVGGRRGAADDESARARLSLRGRPAR